MVWYSHFFQNFPQFFVIHTVKGFGIVNKAKIDIFLELSCFFNYPADVGNLISGSSAFSKTSLNIWKFRVPLLLTIRYFNLFQSKFCQSVDAQNFVVSYCKFPGTIKRTHTSFFPISCGHNFHDSILHLTPNFSRHFVQ